MKPTICLNMIVKDEAHIIDRCLSSVEPFIDSWVIVDTGSTDGTQARVRAALAGVPGELHERPWRNFAHNRNQALDLARDKARYLLFVDADEELIGTPPFDLGRHNADSYGVLHESVGAGVWFYSHRLVRSNFAWRWVGVIHETLQLDGQFTKVNLHEPFLRAHYDSARCSDQKRKHADDAAVLEQALLDDPYNTRHAFHLAQCYRSSDKFEDAEQAYQRRIRMGGSEEEIWYSLYQLGLIRLKLARPWEAVRDTLLAAHSVRSDRAEPLWVLAVCCRQARSHGEALHYAALAALQAEPLDAIFVQREVYQWRALEEYALAAFYVGDLDEALLANESLLSRRDLPISERERITRNAAVCAELIAQCRPRSFLGTTGENQDPVPC